MNRRPRRNRKNAVVRGHIRENHVLPSNLVYPLFLKQGSGIKEEVHSLPGNYRWSIDRAIDEIGECMELGLNSFILFPAFHEAQKDKMATLSYDEEQNYYLEAMRQFRKAHPSMNIITDVAMDPYSIDGHDGIVRDGKIINDETLEVLGKMALAQARAGADTIGPSDMMDGRIGYIREILDVNGFTDVAIMAYTAKYASAMYGPFRDALDSAPREDVDIPKDKKTYQMDPANKQEALIEGMLDYEEGADYMMVKPALHYLDVIHVMKEHFETPVAAYHVSGECAMLTAACQNGWLDYEKAMPETLLSIKRAGADVILTYFAKDFAKRFKAGNIAY